jgi:ATP-dependent helicase HrpB
MIGGRGVRLQPRSQVRVSEFFVALQGVDLPGQADTSVSMASGFDKDFVLEVLRERVDVQRDIYFDEEKLQFFARRVRRIGDLALEEPSLSQASAEEIGSGMVDALVPRWEWLISQHEGLQAWMARWNFWRRHETRFDLGEEQIRQIVEMAAFGRHRVSDVLHQDLVALTETVLGNECVRLFTEQVPARFLAPSGVSHSIHYEELHSAFVEVRLQEIFGLLKTPKIVAGRVPLTFRLLGPNYRPVQVTADLENFWRSGYQEVRKELRARYPKHSWPEDPYSAKPEAKGKRRST